MRTGIATMTLDYGRCPSWLFERMKRLGRVLALAIISEFGSYELIRRLADPVWFQSLGTLMAFDWNASGLTVTTLAALKEALRGLEKEADIFICGGKGKTSRKTPSQILSWSWHLGFDQKKADRLIYSSKTSAKVDSALIQDGFALYHHVFVFNKKGQWAVIQQGMNPKIQRARRYHWLSEKLVDFTQEPHLGIASQARLPSVLNLTAFKSQKNKETSLFLLQNKQNLYHHLRVLSQKQPIYQFKILDLPAFEFSHHQVETEFSNPRLKKIIDQLTTDPPVNFEAFLTTKGVGPKTVRALSLIAEIIYGAKPSYDDPARYSFSFGGKDGTPYPVDRQTYDQTLDILEKAVRKSRLQFKEKETVFRRLEKLRLKNRFARS